LAANEAKSKLLVSVSRELRTPLSVIIGMNDFLLDTNLEIEQRMLVEQVRTSADGLLALLDDINDLTTIDAGKLQQSLVDFDARTILEDAIDVVAIDAITKGLEISGYIDPALPTRVHGDADHLRQILVNLLANAIKYTSTGGVYVTVELEKDSESELTYIFSVQDTGPGVSSETQGVIFELDDESGLATGSGLRLTMSYRMCCLLGGEMKCESTLGRGTRICFTLTFRRTAHKDAAVCSNLVLPAAQGKSVLVVAADEHLREAVTCSAAFFGFNTRSVESLAEMAKLDQHGESATVTIVCPAMRASNPTTRAAAQPAGADDLHASIRAIGARPAGCGVALLLCPITQMGHAAEVRRSIGAVGVYSISSRPVRLSALSSVLQASLDKSFVRVGGTLAEEELEVVEKYLGDDDDLDELMGGSYSAAQVKAMRTLITVGPDLKGPLCALFLAGRHSCEACSSANEVKVMVTDKDGRITFDCLVLDLALLGRKVLQALVKELHHMRRRAPDRRRLIILAIVDQDGAQDTNIHTSILGAGVHSLIAKPLTALKLQHALASGAAAATMGCATDGLDPPPSLSTASPSTSKPAAGEVSPVRRSDETGPKRVLVVDDDAGQQRVLKSILAKENFEVELAKDVAAARVAAGTTCFDLVIVKAALAAGCDAAAELRDAQKGLGLQRMLPIIGIVNSATAAEEVLKCEAAGMSRTLCKPVVKDAFLEAVHDCIQKSIGPSVPDGGGSSAEAAGVIGPRPLKILVADDDAGQRLMLKAMLTKDEHSVVLVDNGADAVSSARLSRFDLIFLQGFMPVMNGWEAFRLIRRSEVETGQILKSTLHSDIHIVSVLGC
jgi:CheY-like chemotaxis protein